jgi:hypothetical protein
LWSIGLNWFRYRIAGNKSISTPVCSRIPHS